MNRLGRLAVDVLIAAFLVLAFLTIAAEAERQEAADIKRMVDQRAHATKPSPYAELDARGRQMTAYNAIAKK